MVEIAHAAAARGGGPFVSEASEKGGMLVWVWWVGSLQVCVPTKMRIVMSMSTSTLSPHLNEARVDAGTLVRPLLLR